jgi:aminoglycoside phosphotransferase (APT) family kinase protein
VSEHLSEEELNRRLRRVDWRFLTDRPHPARAFCRAGPELTVAVTAVAAEIVTDERGRDCDLAVAEDPDAAELDALYRALTPGSTCYTEWSRSGAARAVRALESAGFVDVTCYRRVFSPDGLPLFWVPRGAPGAGRYVRQRLRLPGGRVRRLAAGLRRRLAALVQGRWRETLCVLARRPSSEHEGHAQPVGWLPAAVRGRHLGREVPAGRSTLLMTGGPRSVSKVVLLSFAEPDPLPRFVVKASRVARASAGLRREAEVLGELTKRGAPPGVPRLLFHDEQDGVPLVGESTIEGQPLQELLSDANHHAWALRVTDWLAALATGGPARSSRQGRETVIEPALEVFEREFGAIVDPEMQRLSASIVRSISDLPVVPEQRDFGPWNLLETPAGELAVLDWESAEVEGLPALDLLYYLTFAGFAVDGARDRDARIASYRRQLDATTPTGAVRSECLVRYAEALGLTPQQLRPLAVLVWLIHAPSDFRHAAADTGGSPSREALGQSLFVALWAEEVRRMESDS